MGGCARPPININKPIQAQKTSWLTRFAPAGDSALMCKSPLPAFLSVANTDLKAAAVVAGVCVLFISTSAIACGVLFINNKGGGKGGSGRDIPP